MKNSKLFILLISMLSLSITAQADQSDYRIKGQVVDADTGKPIDFADILLFKTDNTLTPITTLLDEKGAFSYKNVKNGRYTLMIRLLGYDLYSSKDIILTENSCADLGKIPLKPLETGLAEVEVIGEKHQVIYKLDKKIVEASKNILGNGGSAADLLENTSSVRVGVDGDITFRGSSGFQVYIDGKPGMFNGTQALEQVPSSQIENIEIITTPSAKHDTEGDVGMINIITKKHSLKGWSGMLNLSGNTWHSRRADFLLTRQNKKSRWFIGGQWNDRINRSDFKQDNKTVNGNRSVSLNAYGPHKGNKLNRSVKTGWNIELPYTSISLSAEGGHGGRTHNGDMLYTEIIADNIHRNDTTLYFNNNDFENTEDYGSANIEIKRSFNTEGHTLSASYYYKYGGNALEKSYNELNDLDGNRMDGMCYYEAEFRKTMRGNLNYLLPIKKTGNIEAGYQYHAYLEDGDYKIDWWNSASQQFEEEEDAYNTFYFREQVHSIYGVVSARWKNLEIQAGLRGEQTHTELNSSIPDKSRTESRFEVFPSAHMGYHFKSGHHIHAAYSYRTTRAQLWFMEPYITYNDFYSAVIGNPNIRPEYIHSFEMNYDKTWGKHSLTANLFHRYRKDKIERLRVPFKEDVTLDSMANVGRDYSTGIELSAILHNLKNWTMTVNGNVYHYKVKNELGAGGKEESSTNYDILLNNLFTVGKFTRLQADCSFVGPSITTQGKTDTYWYVNMAVRQQFLDRKLTATLSVRDLLRSACYKNDIGTARLQSDTRIKPRYPQIMLSLGYTFNNYRNTTVQEKEDRNEMFEGMNH